MLFDWLVVGHVLDTNPAHAVRGPKYSQKKGRTPVVDRDELALAAAAHWGNVTEKIFASAPYRKLQDPLERLFGYLDFRAAILTGELPEYTCLLGTLVQETYATHPDIRVACERGLSSHIAEVTRDVEAAKRLYVPKASWLAESVGYFMQAVLQGSFIFAKAKQSPEIVLQTLEHLRRYLNVLFSLHEPYKRKEKLWALATWLKIRTREGLWRASSSRWTGWWSRQNIGASSTLTTR